jgi:pantoate--beta-alanine ligase
MIIFKQIHALQKHLAQCRDLGSIGFAPTMGALHEGHLALIRAAKARNRTVVSSIYVNPAQFNDPRDFQKYPVTIEQDIRLLVREGCDVLFLPSVEEIYPSGYTDNQLFDLGMLDEVFEGSFRPGHFQGVCRVVNRLLEIVTPHVLYLGQKDYQQCMVIRRLIELTGRQTEVAICPTLREADGLAMSSRNLRLDAVQRATAPAIYQALLYARTNLRQGPLEPLVKQIQNDLQASGFRPDYFAFANAITLAPRDHWDGQEQLVALVAAFLGEVRLIDNMRMN